MSAIKMKGNLFGKCAKTAAGMHRDERGMTGLETAIILIAFVTVAAVFGYAVLSAGLFSAERGKETVYAGLAQAKANMEISGSVIVIADNDVPYPTQAVTIIFTVRNAIAGTPIDMTPNGFNNSTGTPVGTPGQNRCIISLTTTNAYYNNVEWDVESIAVGDNDNLLESGEQFEITVDLTDLGANSAGVDYPDPALGPNTWFNIQVKPMLGSYMTIQRTLPAGLDLVMDMH